MARPSIKPVTRGWVKNAHMGRNMKPSDRRYQRQITRSPVTLDYRIVAPNGTKADFDGKRRNILHDAKNWGPDGRFMRAYGQAVAGKGGWWPLGVMSDVTEEASRQKYVAGLAGLPVQWSVANRDAARAVKHLLRIENLLATQKDPTGIRVVHVPPAEAVRK